MTQDFLLGNQSGTVSVDPAHEGMFRYWAIEPAPEGSEVTVAGKTVTNIRRGCSITALFATPPSPAPELKKLRPQKEKTVLESGDVITLTDVAEPEGVRLPELAWTTSDDKVATVESGKVSAVGAGKVTIGVAAGQITADIDLKGAAGDRREGQRAGRRTWLPASSCLSTSS